MTCILFAVVLGALIGGFIGLAWVVHHSVQEEEARRAEEEARRARDSTITALHDWAARR